MTGNICPTKTGSISVHLLSARPNPILMLVIFLSLMTILLCANFRTNQPKHGLQHDMTLAERGREKSHRIAPFPCIHPVFLHVSERGIYHESPKKIPTDELTDQPSQPTKIANHQQRNEHRPLHKTKMPGPTRSIPSNGRSQSSMQKMSPTPFPSPAGCR